jgi:hypothetical protein
MSTVRIQTPPGLPPVAPAGRRSRIVELEGLDGAVSLSRLLDILHRSGRRMPVHVAVYVTHEIARALRHLHDAVDRQGRPLGRMHGSVDGGQRPAPALGSGEAGRPQAPLGPAAIATPTSSCWAW